MHKHFCVFCKVISVISDLPFVHLVGFSRNLVRDHGFKKVRSSIGAGLSIHESRELKQNIFYTRLHPHFPERRRYRSKVDIAMMCDFIFFVKHVVWTLEARVSEKYEIISQQQREAM